MCANPCLPPLGANVIERELPDSATIEDIFKAASPIDIRQSDYEPVRTNLFSRAFASYIEYRDTVDAIIALVLIVILIYRLVKAAI